MLFRGAGSFKGPFSWFQKGFIGSPQRVLHMLRVQSIFEQIFPRVQGFGVLRMLEFWESSLGFWGCQAAFLSKVR